MTFIPDPTKQAQEVSFSRKTNTNSPYYVNKNPVMRSNSQKHLGVFLDTKLDFKEHLANTFTNANKNVGLLKEILKQFYPGFRYLQSI